VSELPQPADSWARYAAWIERRRRWVIAASLVFVAGAAVIAARLEVKSDFSYLLPQDVRAVRDLRAIEKRARVIGTAIVAVTQPNGAAVDPSVRRRAAVMLRDRIAALPPDLVSSVTFDHAAERAYAWKNRWLFAPLADLRAARDALREKVAVANPLYVSLDDDTGSGAGSAADALRGKLREAEKTKDDPGEYVGLDRETNRTVQMMIVRTAFSSGDVDKDRELLARIDAILADVRAAVPGVEVGVAGDTVVSVAEHDSILNGMLTATAVTVVLVFAALFWYERSPLAVGAMSWSLVVGTVATFAFTRLAIGHLNLATAFLSSIVIGNGINVSILVTSRYLEELRAGRDGADALAGALRGTARGTLAAALTAAVAYASLVITVFRGFRHFGIIGGVGILLCWLAAYSVLPAALASARHMKMQPHAAPALGRWLAALMPARPVVPAAMVLVLVVAGGAVTARYLARDPFESNFKNLRSHSAAITEEREFMHAIDHAFGQGIDAGFVIAVDKRAEVAPLVARLEAANAASLAPGAPPAGQAGEAVADAAVKPKPGDAALRLFGDIKTLDDALPADQDAKLAVLAEIRGLLTDKKLNEMSDADREEALELRPPADLRKLGDADVPDALAWPFIEADGSRGKIVIATAGPSYEVWDAHDTVRFANNVRALDLPADAHVGGSSFVFADVIEAVLRDGPRATLASIAGAIVVVLLVVGRNRHALIALACGAAGTILMLAASALLGLKINFLDFVALPITIGIGIEYAVNIATRERQTGNARDALATTGGAVALCSYTTIVGYGSLFLSANRGIQSFGLAAMLGELTCLGVALVLAPALLALTRRPQRLRPVGPLG
jgi:hypothetical protein